MALTHGRKLGPYEVISPSSAGGAGEVYRVRDTRLGRYVALTILPEWLVRNADRLRRFMYETQRISGLNNPNIAAVLDVAEVDGVRFVVSELPDGETLREVLNRGALPPRQAAKYTLQIASGLAAAHAAGIIHRDLRPENILVTKDGVIKILDWGMGKPPRVAESEEKTESGTISGVVAYMAPEVLRGGESSPQSDIFSLGALVYEMITGVQAFQRRSVIETAHAVFSDDPLRSGEVGSRIPSALQKTIARCLGKNPARRFRSADEVRTELESLSEKLDAFDLTNVSRRKEYTYLLWLFTLLALVVATFLMILGLLGAVRDSQRSTTMNFALSMLASILAGGIFFAVGYVVRGVEYKKKIDAAAQKYVERLGRMIEEAAAAGRDRVLINARAIIKVRDELREHMTTAVSLLNSEIDRLAHECGGPEVSISRQESQPIKVDEDKVWETIQVLQKAWPAKKDVLTFEIKKMLVELGLVEK
jgi:hypothetical protein